MYMSITDLPSELLYATFDFLDLIDSTCFGLTSKHFYAIHRDLHGFVSLSSRRHGPNDLEWAWRLAGHLIQHPNHPRSADTVVVTSMITGTAKGQALARLWPHKQVYCRKCGTSRCELHRHLREWMGTDSGRSEYCHCTQRFGPPASEGVRGFCYMPSPKKPHHCGRHAGNIIFENMQRRPEEKGKGVQR
jgi:hypothetical protein